MINVDVRGTKKKKKKKKRKEHQSNTQKHEIEADLFNINYYNIMQIRVFKEKKNHKLQNKWKLEDQNPNLLFKGKRAQLKEREISFF